jgi:hypothetical protein
VPTADASTPIAAQSMDEPAGVTTMTNAIDGHHRTLQNVQTGAPKFRDTGSRFNGSNPVAVVPASSDSNSGNANVSFIVHIDFTTVPNAAVVDYDLLRGPTKGTHEMKIVARNNRTKTKALCFFQNSSR